MKKNIFLLTIFVSLFFSCEKEIPIDYRQVSPLYVAEASITQEGTTVRLRNGTQRTRKRWSTKVMVTIPPL